MATWFTKYPCNTHTHTLQKFLPELVRTIYTHFFPLAELWNCLDVWALCWFPWCTVKHLVVSIHLSVLGWGKAIISGKIWGAMNFLPLLSSTSHTPMWNIFLFQMKRIWVCLKTSSFVWPFKNVHCRENHHSVPSFSFPEHPYSPGWVEKSLCLLGKVA